MNSQEPFDGDIVYPVNGILDLHVFRPSDALDVVDDYLAACLERGIYRVRIIHGKGKGIMRARVQSHLRTHPAVRAQSVAKDQSSWGATLVELHAGDPPSNS